MSTPSRTPRPLIVIVEDQTLVRDWLCRVVSQADYECRSVPDGRAALELIDQLDQPPALLITDIRMPQMSGVELGRRLRVLHSGLPVLYVCADDAELPPCTCHWLLKPFRPEQLVTQLRAMLGGDQGENTAG